jgi:hypothetical protein
MEPIEEPELQDMEILSSLEQQLLAFKDIANLALYRLDTINTLIEQEKFEFADTKIRAGGRRANAVRALLEELKLEEDGLTMGVFLKTLNTYLIKNGLVDLNDLQIVLNQVVGAAFHKPLALKKVPYALLLRSLPTMFS